MNGCGFLGFVVGLGAIWRPRSKDLDRWPCLVLSELITAMTKAKFLERLAGVLASFSRAFSFSTWSKIELEVFVAGEDEKEPFLYMRDLNVSPVYHSAVRAVD